MKKFMSVMLSVCMIMMYTVPAFAYTSDAASKRVITDQEMSRVVGGYGNVNAQITTFSASSGLVEAVISSTSGSTSTYVLKVVDGTGATVQTIASGTLGNQNNALIVRGTTTYKTAGNYIAVIELSPSGFGTLLNVRDTAASN